MNKLTNALIATYFKFVQMLIIQTKIGILCILALMW